jgi:hypothetical protein
VAGLLSQQVHTEEAKMKKNVFPAAMPGKAVIIAVLAFGLVMSGCGLIDGGNNNNNGGGNNGGNNGGGGDNDGLLVGEWCGQGAVNHVGFDNDYALKFSAGGLYAVGNYMSNYRYYLFEGTGWTWSTSGNTLTVATTQYGGLTGTATYSVSGDGNTLTLSNASGAMYDHDLLFTGTFTKANTGGGNNGGDGDNGEDGGNPFVGTWRFEMSFGGFSLGYAVLEMREDLTCTFINHVETPYSTNNGTYTYDGTTATINTGDGIETITLDSGGNSFTMTALGALPATFYKQ